MKVVREKTYSIWVETDEGTQTAKNLTRHKLRRILNAIMNSGSNVRWGFLR